jgi:hypothetical protein
MMCVASLVTASKERQTGAKSCKAGKLHTTLKRALPDWLCKTIASPRDIDNESIPITDLDNLCRRCSPCRLPGCPRQAAAARMRTLELQLNRLSHTSAIGRSHRINGAKFQQILPKRLSFTEALTEGGEMSGVRPKRRATATEVEQGCHQE